MCISHNFNAVCYVFTADKGIMHTVVPHCKTVTYTYGRENKRCSACNSYACLNSLCYLVKVHMSRYNIVFCTNNTYQRLFYFCIRKSESFKQYSVWQLLRTFFYCVTSHLKNISLISKTKICHTTY